MRRRKGYILIQALVAVAGLLALMAILVSDDRIAIDNVQSQMDQIRAKEAVNAAIAQSLAVLSTENENEVTLNDTWATMGSSGTEEFDFPDGTSFRLQVVDASSLINLNTASSTQLTELPLLQDQVDSLLDWIQPGETARTDGAKDSFYNSLPIPYNAALNPLTTVNELLLIDNWTGQTLYQPPTQSTTLTLPTDQNGAILPLASLLTVDSGSPNTSSTGAALVNLNTPRISATSLSQLGISTGLAARISAAAPITSFRQLLSLPGINTTNASLLLNSVTFTTGTRNTGKINLNTATQAVLQSLPNLATTDASSIVSQQSTGSTSLGEWATSSGLPISTIAQVADYFTVGSDTWIVRAYGQSGSYSYPEEAVVGFRGGVLQIISVQPLHTGSIPSWWGWQTATTSTEQAGVTQ